MADPAASAPPAAALEGRTPPAGLSQVQVAERRMHRLANEGERIWHHVLRLPRVAIDQWSTAQFSQVAGIGDAPNVRDRPGSPLIAPVTAQDAIRPRQIPRLA
jgi:hypothetical protein